MTTTDPTLVIGSDGLSLERIGRWLRQYGVLVLLVALFVALSIGSDAFLSSRNLLNILNQNLSLIHI